MTALPPAGTAPARTSPVTATAVLFDMDGLLVDSEPLWTLAEVDLAARLGGRWSDDVKAAVVGTRLDTAVPTILRWYGVPSGPTDVAAAMAFLLQRMVDLFRNELPVLPGALELVQAVRDRGLPVGLVSSSYRVLVDAAAAQLDLGFDVTVAGDEVACGKPHPEPYLAACGQLDVDPRLVVVLEDAASGVQSAEAAGCVAVAVPSVAPVPSLPHRPVVASLADVDPDWLVRLPPVTGGAGG